MGGAKPRASAEATTRPQPPHRAPLHCHSLPLSVIPAPFRHSCAGRNPARATVSSPASATPANATHTSQIVLSKLYPSSAIPKHHTPHPHTPSPIHPSPLPGGRLGGRCEAPSKRRSNYAPPTAASRTPPLVIPAPSPSFCPFPSFLRRQEPTRRVQRLRPQPQTLGDAPAQRGWAVAALGRVCSLGGRLGSCLRRNDGWGAGTTMGRGNDGKK